MRHLMLEGYLGVAILIEWMPPAEEVIKYYPTCEHIDFLYRMKLEIPYFSVALVADLLRCHEHDGANLVIKGKFLSGLEARTKPEVNYNNRVGGELLISDHDVFGFQVPVDDVHPVDLSQTKKYPLEDARRLIFCEDRLLQLFLNIIQEMLSCFGVELLLKHGILVLLEQGHLLSESELIFAQDCPH